MFSKKPLTSNDSIYTTNTGGSVTIANSPGDTLLVNTDNNGLTWGTADMASSTNLIINPIMKIKQVKVAIFSIKRDKHTQEVTKTKFLKEIWLEQKPNVSLELLVAKELDSDYDPANIVIKTLSSIEL